MSTSGPASTPSASLSNAAAALLLQQKLQSPLSSSGVSSAAAQALLKQQEDQLRATRLLLQQRQLDELIASNQGTAAAAATAKVAGSAPASRSNSVLACGPVAGLLGQDTISSALAAVRRASVESVKSSVSDKAAASGDESEEEDDLADEEYFKAYATTGDDRASKEDADDKAGNESFPHKLYRMLYEAEAGGHEAIVSFLPSGRGFIIHKPKDFVAEIMPRYFTTRRIASFQRQLNLYGFRRISEGKEKGAYFHKDFIKGKRTRVQRIKRKSTAARPCHTSFAHRFATAPLPLQFPTIATTTSNLYGGAAVLSGSVPAINNATKELLLARYSSAAGAPILGGASASASLLDIARQEMLATANRASARPQDILRNVAASVLFNNNNANPGPF